MTHSTPFFLILVFLYAAACLLYWGGWFRMGRGFLVAAALLNAFFLIHHSVITGVFIGNALLDPPFFIPFAIAVILIIIPVPKDMTVRAMGLALVFLISIVLFAAYYPKGIIPPAPNKSGIWSFLFFLTENCAYALFGLSGILVVLSGSGKGMGRTVRRLVIIGFISFSIAQVVGAYWSFLGWGHPFMWGSRHISSASVWLIYAALIHMRFLNSFIIPERWLTAAGGAFSMYIVYSHLVFEMGIHRVGG